MGGRLPQAQSQRSGGFSRPSPASLLGIGLVTLACATPPCPTVPRAEKGLSPAEVHWSVRSNWAAFSGCWDYKPSAATATIALRVVISEQGRVQSASTLYSTFNDEAVHGCFENRMARVVFPPRSKPTKTRVHLVFDPPHGDRP